jgi:DNA-binding transcriptional LysR family regulator
MKLDDMQLFVVVVETGSFTKAADYCHMPKSTISRHISQLEKDLSTRLLQRTTRSLNLTEEGEHFYRRALSILEQVEETRRELSEERAELKGKLVLYAPTLIVDKCSHQVVKFQQEHPGCELELHSTAIGQRTVLDRRFDLMMYIGEPFDSSFIARSLADLGYDYFASPEYIERHGLPSTPEELADHRCIYRIANENDSISWTFGEHELPLDPTVICDSPYMANSMTLQGAGIARLPLILAADSVAAGHLEPVFGDRFGHRRPIYGLYSSRHYLPHRVETLIASIQENLPSEIEQLESGILHGQPRAQL